MTDADIIRRLAELRGWKVKDCHTGPGTEGMLRVGNRMWWPHCHCGDATWNPLESIADAWELEGSLPEEKQGYYTLELYELIEVNMRSVKNRNWCIRRASPRQICMAYIAAHGVQA